jgi:GH15 family glucan-1,4-alpha-glucosidase
MPISFPPIHRHGVIGDRRTGALVAADGTLSWFCVPDFDGPPLFGMLLDPDCGGFCRFGPARASLGWQHYLPETAAVVTNWRGTTQGDSVLELTDVMAWPADERPQSARDQRVIVRRLQAREPAAVRFEAQPRWEFGGRAEEVRLAPQGATFRFGAGQLAVWASFPVRIEAGAAIADLTIGAGDELWAVIGWNSHTGDWSRERATELFDAALRYWGDWTAGLKVDAAEARATGLRRSAITVHLLTHAEHDSAAAALTTRQRQLGSLAFFADCASIYVENGGAWQDKHWQVLQRAANYTCAHWHLPESGIWELAVDAHYVAGKVMSWVVLKRAEEIARHTGHGEKQELARWRTAAETIHAEVMDKGWNQNRNSFVQRYDCEALDAAALLIPLMEFLPADHPRVTGTLAAIERELVIDGLVYRFEPHATLGGDQLPVGEFEGAFLPATFWFVHALAKAGRADEAEAILKRCEAMAGELGLFAEEADARRQTFLGNTPLLFAHVEYVRAAAEVARARGLRSQKL